MSEIVISQKDFSIDTEYKALCSEAPKAGAVVIFTGLVRDYCQHDNKKESVSGLFLEHYAGMTESLLQQIVDQAKSRWSVEAVRIIHRVGELRANEQIVFVGVASVHRNDAFNCAQFIMDYLKTKATIWKKEITERGSKWIEQRNSDLEAANRWGQTDDKQ